MLFRSVFYFQPLRFPVETSAMKIQINLKKSLQHGLYQNLLLEQVHLLCKQMDVKRWTSHASHKETWQDCPNDPTFLSKESQTSFLYSSYLWTTCKCKRQSPPICKAAFSELILIAARPLSVACDLLLSSYSGWKWHPQRCPARQRIVNPSNMQHRD